MTRTTKLAGGAVLLGLALLLPLVSSSYYLALFIQILIFGLLAMSIDLLTGYTGLVPLGHAGIFGSSTYMLAYLLVRSDWSYPTAIVSALLFGAVVGALFGLLAIRTTGIYFIMITLAEGMIVWGIAYRWTSVTGGANGIRGLDRPDVLSSEITFYYLVLVIVLLALWSLKRIVNSPFGLTLQGIREREGRMSALGYNVTLHKFLGFFLSGIYASVSGVLFGMYNGFISPGSMDFITSAEALLMVIVGGAGTLWGSLIGSAVVLVTHNIVSLFTDRWMLVLGIIFVLTVLFARQGIMGVLKDFIGDEE